MLPAVRAGRLEKRELWEIGPQNMQPQAKACLEPPEARRGSRALPPQCPEGVQHLDFAHQNCNRIHFCLIFLSHHWWQFIMVA